MKQQQRPISLERTTDLKPIVQPLIKDGFLDPCISPFNTPILPVQKTNGTYRLKQNLRKVNEIVRKRHSGF